MKTEAQKEALFYARLARVGRLNAGCKAPSDRRQKRRCVRLLGLAHLHLAESRPGLDRGTRLYRRAISRI